MVQMNVETEIFDLIASKREGDFWDFKQEPHENKASLLHDILCLSNSLHRGNRFLIYGVTDPKDGAEIVGLEQKQVNRKTQVQFVDFLRSKSFAGDCRPEIEFHTVEIDGKEIDVLMIYDNPNKPYYLTEDYKDKDKIVRANSIYTRTNDTNTPIDKCADIGVIEKMWRQRFRLDLSPLERMKFLLRQPHEWFKDIGNKSYAYHLDFPEFRIEFSEVHEFWETFSFFFTNEKSYLGNAAFKYNSTILFELEYMYCDEMRIELSLPKTASLRLKNDENWFYYYNLEELEGIFLYFLTNGLTHLHSRCRVFPFVLFDNDKQLEKFKEYIVVNENVLNEIKPSIFAELAMDKMNKQGKYTEIDPIFIDKIIQMKKGWP